ncbi:RHS repeat-associated core domain-containing protein [Cellulomonas sp. Leaf334]|uniref:RHS repeat domain-containing protein n=1 Tax=Cellulomonas sp. Leaf334 TaxID=1736339 RepID=UPI0012E260CB|nr:RHS repeat-associated core domain-containing protein [Cellulomonas sp. Leaf334]
MARDWANGSGNEGWVGIRAESETDNFGFKKFFSADYGAYVPSVWMTYNSTPSMPTGLQISATPNPSANGSWSRSDTPTLSATISDPDGGKIHGMFEVADKNQQVIYTQNVLYVPSGSVASITLPKNVVTNSDFYYFRVRVSDDIIEGPRSAWFNFGIDTSAPPAPTVTSTQYPSVGWTQEPGTEGTFNFTMSPKDDTVVAYRWGLDKAPDPAQQVAGPGGNPAALKLSPADAGTHALQVQAIDRAGAVSATSKYTFRVGKGGIVGPDEGTRVVRRVRLSVEAMPSLTYVSFEWRRGPDATTTEPIKPAVLSTSAGLTWANDWQQLPTGTSYTTWDVGRQFGSTGGPVQVRAQLSASPTGASPTPTQWVTLVIDPDADGAATTTIGPGSVNLLTGDHTLSVTDAEEFGLSLVRTTSSRDTDSGLQLQADLVPTAHHDATTLPTPSNPNAIASVDTTRHHTGTTSFKLLPPASGNVDSFIALGSGMTNWGPNGALRAGRTYRMSGWIYVPTATGLSPSSPRGLGIAVLTKVDGNWVDTARTPLPTLKDAWQQISVDVTIPATATDALVRLYNGFGAAGKDVYFDDLSVNELWSPFGPEWSTGTTDAASGTAYTKVTRPYDDIAAVQLTGGGEIWFTQGGNGTWWPEPGAEALTLTTVAPGTFQLAEIDGTTTVFTRTGTTGDFPVRMSTPPAAAGGAQYVYDTALEGVSRLKRIIAPIEPGVNDWPTNTQACRTDLPEAAPAKGCEVMQFDYFSDSTQPNSFAGRLSTVSVWSWNGTAMAKTPVAQYGYNSTGQLVTVKDPRIEAAGASPLVTTYSYEANAGRLASVKAPGEEPYTYTYGVAGNSSTGAGDWVDPDPGRLLSVSRASLDSDHPTNTTSIVYGVPLTTGAGGPYDLDAATIGNWAQQDGPTDATAIFDPLNPPGVNTATPNAPTLDQYKHATISYLNSSGLEVNTASPMGRFAPAEGFIDTAEYDKRGNVVRTLDATNRLYALKKWSEPDPLAGYGLEGKTSLDLAQLLDTRSTYSDDGIDLLSQTGPLQRLAVDNNANDVRTLRPTTTNVYDEGKPDGAAYHLLTTTTSAGVEYPTGTVFDPLVTKNGYDPIVQGVSKLDPSSGWKHGQPTSVTVDAGQPSQLTSTVVYDARGRAIRSSKPGSTGTDAATTISVFYTAGTNPDDPACANKPEWAGQPCVTRAAGPAVWSDPTPRSADLPVKRVEAYNLFGSPTVVTDAVGPAGAGQVKRTATTTYDAADRVISVSLTGNSPEAGAAVGTTTTKYDNSTGDVVENSSTSGGTITKEYDGLGRLTKYTDADGGVTTTAYDRLGQPIKVENFAGTSLIGTRDYVYDRKAEPRGFVTKMTDPIAGTFEPTWGPDGQLASQKMPAGVTLTLTYDTARVPTKRAYTRTADGQTIYSDKVVENHRGQWITHDSNSGTRTYTYDRLGRLTDVADASVATGTCTSRTYGYDTHTNRTSIKTASAAGAGTSACPGTAGATSAVSTYDSADRLLTTTGTTGKAWTYDAFGRTMTMPTADGSATAMNGYFVNDLVASQEVPAVAKSTWGLDPLQRFSSEQTFKWINSAWVNSTEQVSHYDGDDDEPAWIVEDITLPDRVTRYVEGMDGAMAAQTSATGDRVLQLVDLHGDVIATVPYDDPDTAPSFTPLRVTSFDEFGVPQPMTSGQTGQAPPRYGWLGAAQRSADTPTGTILMGVRLYSPTTGRFLSVDPVAGGSANDYDYCRADPVNCTDLDGRLSWKGVALALNAVATAASFVPAVFCQICGAVALVAGTGSALASFAAKDYATGARTLGTTAAGLAFGGAGRIAFKGAASVAARTGAIGRAATKVARAYNNSRLGRFGGVDGAILRASKHPSYRGLPGARGYRSYVQYAVFGMTQMVDNWDKIARQKQR